MSNNLSYTSSTLTSGITLTPGASPEPGRVPKGLITTRAVELKDGWVGQVIVAERVVREKAGFGTAQVAEEWATSVVIDTFRTLLSDPENRRAAAEPKSVQSEDTTGGTG